MHHGLINKKYYSINYNEDANSLEIIVDGKKEEVNLPFSFYGDGIFAHDETKYLGLLDIETSYSSNQPTKFHFYIINILTAEIVSSFYLKENAKTNFSRDNDYIAFDSDNSIIVKTLNGKTIYESAQSDNNDILKFTDNSNKIVTINYYKQRIQIHDLITQKVTTYNMPENWWAHIDTKRNKIYIFTSLELYSININNLKKEELPFSQYFKNTINSKMLEEADEDIPYSRLSDDGNYIAIRKNISSVDIVEIDTGNILWSVNNKLPIMLFDISYNGVYLIVFSTKNGDEGEFLLFRKSIHGTYIKFNQPPEAIDDDICCELGFHGDSFFISSEEHNKIIEWQLPKTGKKLASTIFNYIKQNQCKFKDYIVEYSLPPIESTNNSTCNSDTEISRITSIKAKYKIDNIEAFYRKKEQKENKEN